MQRLRLLEPDDGARLSVIDSDVTGRFQAFKKKREARRERRQATDATRGGVDAGKGCDP